MPAGQGLVVACALIELEDFWELWRPLFLRVDLEHVYVTWCQIFPNRWRPWLAARSLRFC